MRSLKGMRCMRGKLLLFVIIAGLAPYSAFSETLGAFRLDVPTGWKPLARQETALLKTSFDARIRKIYGQYAGGNIPVDAIEVIAWWSPAGGRLSAIRMPLPPQADLMLDLKEEAQAKAKWGTESGFVRRASDVKPLAKEGFEGFKIEFESSDGSMMITGGLQPVNSKTQIIQIEFITGRGESAAVQIFDQTISSIELKK
jgi:hypothetical protein